MAVEAKKVDCPCFLNGREERVVNTDDRLEVVIRVDQCPGPGGQ
jgi:hypothetical protein